MIAPTPPIAAPPAVPARPPNHEPKVPPIALKAALPGSSLKMVVSIT